MSKNTEPADTAVAAKILGLPVETVRMYCWRGLFPNAFKEGRDWRIPRSDLELPHIINRRRGRHYS